MVGVNKTACVGNRGKVLAAALMVTTALATTLVVSPALAQQAMAATPKVAQLQGEQNFDIPAQPLTDALVAFGQKSGVQGTVDGTVARDVSAPAVQGIMTSEQALRQLLAGSGLTYTMSGSTVAIEKLAQGKDGTIVLDPVTVEGQAESAYGPVEGYVAHRSATGTKTDTPLIEVPRSISVITADQISDLNIQSVDQSLRYTSGVATEQRGVDLSRSDFVIRGFSGDTYVNGMRGETGSYAFANHEVYGFERVEVLKGPASTLYGSGNPGGIVNLVTKRPMDEFHSEVGGEAGTFSQHGGKFDIGGPIDDAKNLLVRFTGLVRDGHTQIDFTDDKRLYLAPAFTWNPSEDTTFTILSSYQKDDTVDAQFLPASGTLFSNPNGTISSNLNTGEPDFDKFVISEYSLGYDLNHHINSGWEINHDLRYTHSDLNYKDVYSLRFLADNRTLQRRVFVADENSWSLTTDTNTQVRADFGPTSHTMLVGADYKKTALAQVFADGAAPGLDAFSPVYGQSITVPSPYLDQDQDSYQVGVYVQDQVKFYEKFILTFGGRHDWAGIDTTNNFSGSTTRQRDSAFTGHAGLTYLFGNGVAPYISYAESFDPIGGTDAGGNPFAPTTGTQYEIGVKFQPENSNTLATVSLFELTQKNLPTADPNNPGFRTQTGEIRSRGVELEIKHNVTEELNLTGAYSFTDAEITKSNDGTLGFRPYGVPKHLFSIWADYSAQSGALDGFGLGAGYRYASSTLDSSNTLTVPGYGIFDAALHYDVPNGTFEGFRLSLNAANLLDKEYISTCRSSDRNCFFGSRRTVTANITYRW